MHNEIYKGAELMLIYHGSNFEVSLPRIIIPTRGLDFGVGFYTTTNKDQAIGFTENVLIRNKGVGKRIVSIYEIDEDKIKQELSVKEFVGVTDEWFDFVYENRNQKYSGLKYDVIIGAVANDTVYKVFNRYEDGIIDRETAINQLKIKELYNQFVFANGKALAYLNFVNFEEVS